MPLREECDELIGYFWGVLGGYSDTGLKSKDADEVDDTLATYGLGQLIRVDGAKLEQSTAAWVWVITSQAVGQFAGIANIRDRVGVLTWDDRATEAHRVAETLRKGWMDNGTR